MLKLSMRRGQYSNCFKNYFELSEIIAQFKSLISAFGPIEKIHFLTHLINNLLEMKYLLKLVKKEGSTDLLLLGKKQIDFYD